MNSLTGLGACFCIVVCWLVGRVFGVGDIGIGVGVIISFYYIHNMLKVLDEDTEEKRND